MGFYHPATLVKDAQRHGVRCCRSTSITRAGSAGGDRAIGPLPELRVRAPIARGAPPRSNPPMRQRCAAPRAAVRRRSAQERGRGDRARAGGGPFRAAEDLARRAGLRGDELERLGDAAPWAPSASAGARRSGRPPAPPAPPARSTMTAETAYRGSPLREMTAFEETVADFAGTGMTTGAHPVATGGSGSRRRA